MSVKELNYPRGDALIAEYRRRFGDTTILSFSRGKDSIAVALHFTLCEFSRAVLRGGSCFLSHNRLIIVSGNRGETHGPRSFR